MTYFKDIGLKSFGQFFRTLLKNYGSMKWVLNCHWFLNHSIDVFIKAVIYQIVSS